MRTCSCERSALCDECFRQAIGHWRGVALARGELWAEDVAKVVAPASRAWWPYEGRAVELALGRVAELGHDQKLHAVLARACWEGAERRWTHLAAHPPALD